MLCVPSISWMHDFIIQQQIIYNTVNQDSPFNTLYKDIVYYLKHGIVAIKRPYNILLEISLTQNKATLSFQPRSAYSHIPCLFVAHSSKNKSVPP